jgi:hypothetical protein
MSYVVKVFYDDHELTVITTEAAKEAFAKAVEWQLEKRCPNVTIDDGNRSFTIPEFSLAMASQDIANAVREQ